MVTKVMSHSRRAGMSFAMARTAWMSIPIQGPEEEPSAAAAKDDVAEKIVLAVLAGESWPVAVVLSFASGVEAIAGAASVTRPHIGRHRLR